MRALLAAWFRFAHRRELAMLASIPGPVPIALIGNGLDLLGGDLHTKLESWRARWGDLALFWIFGKPSLLTAKPEHVYRILVTQPEEWIKNVPRAATKPTGGESVFRSPGPPDWKPRRVAHPFEQPWVNEFFEGIWPTVRGVTRARFAKLGTAHVDLYEEILKCSWDSFALGALGETLPPEAFVEHETLLREVGRRGALPIAFSIDPVFWWRRARWLARIERRLARGSIGEGLDLVSRMAKAGSDLGTRRVRDEIGNIFAAGMKNAALAASATAFVLGKHPEWRERAIAELRAAGGVDAIDRNALVALPILDRVVKETLRLYPSVAGFVREVAPGHDVVLDGAHLPQGTQVFLISWVVHRHPDVWPDPTRFDPDRFLVEPAPGTYFPFGLGERFCVGRDWTLLVCKGIVATLLGHENITLDASTDYETKLVAVLTIPKRGVPAMLAPRDGT